LVNIGFRILQVKNRPNQEMVEKFRYLATSLISDNINRLYGIGASLRPYHKNGKMVGTAFTVKTRPGDNLMVHKAIDLAKPGDVLVVDAGGSLSNAIVGEIMMRLAEKNGISGFVIDGAIRDSGIIGRETFPVYARGVTHKGPYKDGPGEINVTVCIDGTPVEPGDIIVGDEDGLVVVPKPYAKEILMLAQQQQKREEEVLKSIKEGNVDRRWVDELLQKKGCGY
jgi:RraA family protein